MAAAGLGLGLLLGTTGWAAAEDQTATTQQEITITECITNNGYTTKSSDSPSGYICKGGKFDGRTVNKESVDSAIGFLTGF
ncbi:MAG: hypothetical protein ACRDTG_11040 [Pseudonocardiaceae bacterium]